MRALSEGTMETTYLTGSGVQVSAF